MRIGLTIQKLPETTELISIIPVEYDEVECESMRLPCHFVARVENGTAVEDDELVPRLMSLKGLDDELRAPRLKLGHLCDDN